MCSIQSVHVTYGLPNGPCPQKRCDETVRLRQRALMLCHDCELVISRQEHSLTKTSMSSSTVPESTENRSLPKDTHRAIPSASLQMKIMNVKM